MALRVAFFTICEKLTGLVPVTLATTRVDITKVARNHHTEDKRVAVSPPALRLRHVPHQRAADAAAADGAEN